MLLRSCLVWLQAVYRWDRPAEVSPSQLPSLSWGYARVHGGASMQGRKDVSREAPSYHSASLGSPSAAPSPAGDSTTGLGVGVGFAAPVFARGWGNHVQLLQVQPPDGYGVEYSTLRSANATASREGNASAILELTASAKQRTQAVHVFLRCCLLVGVRGVTDVSLGGSSRCREAWPAQDP